MRLCRNRFGDFMDYLAFDFLYGTKATGEGKTT